MEIAKMTNVTWNSFDEEVSGCSAPATWTGRCNPNKGNTCGPCKERISLAREIQLLEQALSTLRATEASNKTKINTTHDPLSHLPIELVSDIFRYLRPLPVALDDYPFDFEEIGDVAKTMKDLLLLGAVCKAWRSFAWSLPRLWTTISVNVYNENENAPDMIRQWLGRSEELPLCVYLYAPRRPLDGEQSCPRPSGDEPYLARLTHAINASSERWFYLDIDLPKHFMKHVCGFDTYLRSPMLEMLTLQLAVDDDDDDDEDPHIDNEDATECIYLREIPNLKKIILFSLTFDDIVMEWESITHVYSQSNSPLPIAMCHNLLRNAPGLKNLTLEDGTGPIILPTSVFRHQCLTSLRMNGCAWQRGADVFLSSLDLPALEDLDIFTNREYELDTLEAFLQRSSCTLKKFRLNICNRWMEIKKRLIVLLEKMPCLEILELECSIFQRHESPNLNVSQRPTLTMIQETKSINEHFFLPNLHTVNIRLRCHRWSSSLDLQIGPDESTITSPRGSDENHIVPSDKLRFEPSYIYYLLDPYTRRTIRPIIESGSWDMPPEVDLHPILNFLRQSLHYHVHSDSI